MGEIEGMRLIEDMSDAEDSREEEYRRTSVYLRIFGYVGKSTSEAECIRRVETVGEDIIEVKCESIGAESKRKAREKKMR